MMDKQVIKCSRVVKVLGIMTTVVFGLICLGTYIAGYDLAALCFLPFVGLGALILLVYKKQTIEIGEKTLMFNYIFKNTLEVRYTDIKCLLLIPLGNRTQMVLIDRHYQRLVTLDQAFGNLEILFDALYVHHVDIVDFEELIDKKKNVSKYVQAFNIVERHYYKSLLEEDHIIERMPINQASSRKILKNIGIFFVILDVVAFIMGGKMMMVLSMFVIVFAYVVYLWYYPYIYIEVKTKKGEEVMLQMPILGPAIALLLNLTTLNIFGYEFLDYLKITIILTILFSIPFMIKTFCVKVPQRFIRKLSVVFAVLVFSFTITFPINFLLTFDKSEHETIMVMDKDVDAGNSLTDYELIAFWRGEERSFNVSKRQYLNTSVGDTRKVCIRKSILGLEYYSVHE